MTEHFGKTMENYTGILEVRNNKLNALVQDITRALIESGGWEFIGREEFPCPDCGCKDRNHSVSDCELFKVYESYKAEMYRITCGPCDSSTVSELY